MKEDKKDTELNNLDPKLLTSLLNEEFINLYYGESNIEKIIDSLKLPLIDDNVQMIWRSLLLTQYLLINEYEIKNSKVILDDDYKNQICYLNSINIHSEELIQLQILINKNKNKDIELKKNIKQFINLLNKFNRNQFFLNFAFKMNFNFNANFLSKIDSLDKKLTIKLVEELIIFLQNNEDHFQNELNYLLDEKISLIQKKLD